MDASAAESACTSRARPVNDARTRGDFSRPSRVRAPHERGDLAVHLRAVEHRDDDARRVERRERARDERGGVHLDADVAHLDVRHEDVAPAQRAPGHDLELPDEGLDERAVPRATVRRREEDGAGHEAGRGGRAASRLAEQVWPHLPEPTVHRCGHTCGGGSGRTPGESARGECRLPERTGACAADVLGW